MATPVARKAISDAFKAALKTIKVAGGYSRDLPDNNFHKNYKAEALRQTEPQTYPKVFITMGDEQNTAETSRRKNVEVKVWVTLVVLQSDKGVNIEPEDQLLPMLDDLEKCLMNNPTLSGTVNDLNLDGASYDSGFAHPEGIAIAEITLKYFKQY